VRVASSGVLPPSPMLPCFKHPTSNTLPCWDLLGTVQRQEPLASLEAAALCDGRNTSCGGWTCPRWDGEATAEELTAQTRSPLLMLSIAFLVSGGASGKL
jgi:hypothetical protein